MKTAQIISKVVSGVIMSAAALAAIAISGKWANTIGETVSEVIVGGEKADEQ